MSKPKVRDSISTCGLKKKSKVDFPTAPDGRLIIQEDKVEIPSTSREDFDSGAYRILYKIIVSRDCAFLGWNRLASVWRHY